MTSVSPEDLFTANVPLIERLSRFVCREARMNPADADDFVSHVMLKLVNDDYAVLRKFEGRCQLSSFLIVVVRRALSDFLARERGKYRPSKEGQPERTPRPMPVALDDVAELHDSAADDGLRFDRMEGSRTVSERLRGAIGELPAEDQTILRLHFGAGWTVAEISRSMRIDQQQLYARVRKICKTFRERLLGAGIDAARVNDLVGRADVDFDFGLDSSQIPNAKPSSVRERGAEHEESAR
jgi:RNA polymerase sigma factor (sigma-70 family)